MVEFLGLAIAIRDTTTQKNLLLHSAGCPSHHALCDEWGSPSRPRSGMAEARLRANEWGTRPLRPTAQRGSRGRCGSTISAVTTKLKIGYRKLEELEFQCYHNGLRLHEDSVALFWRRSFASAFALSVISAEELGKGFAINEIVFQARIGEGFHDDDEKFVRLLLSDHKLKQGWFVSSLFGIDAPKQVLKNYQRMQTEKNNAFYVGVRKGNHQIVRPFLISKSKARNQIRMVNNALIKFIQVRLTDLDYDEECYDQVFRRRPLLKKLKAAAAALRQQ